MKPRDQLSEILYQHETPSPLYPESPSEQALVVVRRQEFQEVLHYRLTQALYQNRSIPEILFPHVASKLPTFDRYIDAEVFADEEAIEIGRFIRPHLSSDTAPSEEVQSVIDKLLASGELKPSSHEEVDREEKWRRHLLMFAHTFRKGEYKRTEEIAKELSVATKGEDGEKLGSHFRSILTPLIESTLEPLLHQKKYTDLLEILYIATLCTFIPPAEFAQFTQMITRYPEVRGEIGTGLLRKLSLRTYDEAWDGLRSYGIPEKFLRECVHPHIGDYILASCKGKDGVDSKKLLESIEKLLSRSLLSEEWIYESVLLTLLQYVGDSVIGKAGWVSIFSDMKKYVHERNMFTTDEFEHHPLIRERTKKYLIEVFDYGHDPKGLAEAMDEVIDARIFTRKEMGESPELLTVADGYFEQYCGDELYERKKFDVMAGVYIAMGIGDLTRYRNLPAVKRGREAVEGE